ncbi:hypothetical protein [Neobacillus niacini]|uniref:hypothetical protein n=1 Tax=Neobacillus niacini TaxID=86668 RepID=UPI0005EEB56E|nr:hypothetical protein [Neobacillus niacini]
MNNDFYLKVEDIEKKTTNLIKDYQQDFYQYLVNKEHLLEIEMEDTNSLFKHLADDPGIYYFEERFPKFEASITFDEFHEDFTSKWNEIGDTYKSPKFYKTNAEYHFNKIRHGHWVPFYLGKRKKLKNRVMEHILGPKSNKTYAMRLKDRKLDLKYRMSYISLKNLEKEQYFLVEHFEKELRKQLNPIVGKQ